MGHHGRRLDQGLLRDPHEVRRHLRDGVQWRRDAGEVLREARLVLRGVDEAGPVSILGEIEKLADGSMPVEIPQEADVRAALADNLCRCGTHNRIVRAVLRASQEA